ncbi:MAG TPA: ABC transporter permease [Gaiellaceae bacterium]|jgi:simple sugar transport system permease protein|nr:ABC transporter permease [Gaiellaceae bacterium]
MALDEQAPLAEREAARPARGGRWWTATRGLLTGRPETGALFGAAVMFVIFAFIAPSSDTFTSRIALSGLLSITAELGIVAMAVTLLMIAGHFDLSVGSVLGFSSFIVPYLMLEYGYSIWVAALIAVGVAISIGLINGMLVVTTRIPSFIVTLGTLLIWRGVLLGISGGEPAHVEQESILFKIFSYRIESGPFRGYQVSVLWFIGVMVVLTFVLLRTRFGNWIFASGGNERSARSMGVPADRVWLVLFVLTAIAAFLSGLIQVGRFNVVEATRGQGYELQAIAAAVIGGARLNGGYGSVVGAGLGALMIAMIQQGLVLSGIASYWLQVAVGALIIGAVIVNQVLGRSRPQI